MECIIDKYGLKFIEKELDEYISNDLCKITKSLKHTYQNGDIEARYTINNKVTSKEIDIIIEITSDDSSIKIESFDYGEVYIKGAFKSEINIIKHLFDKLDEKCKKELKTYYTYTIMGTDA